jgi:hypothetical protein
MILNGRTQRLNEKYILFATIRLELYLNTVVRKSLQLGWQQRNVKLRANLFRQYGMSATTEDGNRTHRVLLATIGELRAQLISSIKRMPNGDVERSDGSATRTSADDYRQIAIINRTL